MNKKQLEGTKLICDYMGYNIGQVMLVGPKHWWIGDQSYNLEEMKFHSEWQWLRPVIDQLEERDHFRVSDAVYALPDINHAFAQVMECIGLWNEAHGIAQGPDPVEQIMAKISEVEELWKDIKQAISQL